jgi:hypothetical protein
MIKAEKGSNGSKGEKGNSGNKGQAGTKGEKGEPGDVVLHGTYSSLFLLCEVFGCRNIWIERIYRLLR